MAGLWIVTALFFGSAVITVRLRNPIDRSWKPVITYHGVSLILILSLWSQGFATVSMAAAFAAALLKLLFILWQFNWYERTPIENVTLFDALGAIFFLTILASSALPLWLVLTIIGLLPLYSPLFKWTVTRRSLLGDPEDD
jgi:hypothetical protein